MLFMKMKSALSGHWLEKRYINDHRFKGQFKAGEMLISLSSLDSLILPPSDGIIYETENTAAIEQ